MSAEQVTESWAVIERWLAKNAPQTYASLRPPADPAAVEAAQQTIGVTFPEDLLASLARHDGCDSRPGGFRLPMTSRLHRGDPQAPRADRQLHPGDLRLLSVAEIVAGWQKAADELRTTQKPLSSWDDPETGPQWTPFAAQGPRVLRVLNCQPDGEFHGLVGRYLGQTPGTDFHSPLTLGALLELVAETFRLGGPVEEWIPVTVQGHLRWAGLTAPHHPAPRSLLAVAATYSEPVVPPAPRSTPPHDPEFGWVSEYDEICLSFVHGISQPELFRRFNVDPARIEPRSREQVDALQRSWTEGYRPLVRAGYAGDWVFAVEEPYAEGRRPERLRRLSAGTWAVAVAYSSGHLRCTIAADGTTVVDYDNTRPEQREGRDPDRFLPALRAAGLLADDPGQDPDLDVANLFGVLRRELGIVFDGRILHGALPAAPYRPALPASMDSLPQPGPLHPLVSVLLAHAPEPRLRAAALAQARRLAAETGLCAYPEVADALGRTARGERWQVDDDSPLGLRLHQIMLEAAAASASSADPQAKGRLTGEERLTWSRRAGAAVVMIGVASRPPTETLPYLLRQRLSPDWHDELVDDLGPVDVPEGAVEELIAERERTAAAQATRPEPESGPFSEVARQRQQLRRQRRSGR